MSIDKSLLTSLSAIVLTLAGFLMPQPLRAYVSSAGLFAVSGALTNWLAVYMLFERVPGFYGSGVVPLHFAEFKAGIRRLIMKQFFSQENIDNFMSRSEVLSASLEQELLKIVDEVDLDGAYDSLLDVIMASSYASMLGLIGGRDAFKTLRQPFIEKMRGYLHTTVASEDFQNRLAKGLTDASSSMDLRGRIEQIVDRRLDELTPALVKAIVEDMIKRHLGWLVVWGGVIGGFLGLMVAIGRAWLFQG